MRVRPALLIALAAALVAWGAVWAVGRSTSVASAARERAEIAEANAAVVTKAYKAARDSIPYLRTEARTARAEAEYVRANVQETLSRARMISDSARAVIVDSRADVPTLRTALVAQVAATDSIAAAFARYREVVDKAFAASDRLTITQAEALALADSTIRAKDHAIAAWKAAATCRVLWFECPTRTQVAVIAVVTTVVVSKAAK